MELPEFPKSPDLSVQYVLSPLAGCQSAIKPRRSDTSIAPRMDSSRLCLLQFTHDRVVVARHGSAAGPQPVRHTSVGSVTLEQSRGHKEAAALDQGRGGGPGPMAPVYRCRTLLVICRYYNASIDTVTANE